MTTELLLSIVMNTDCDCGKLFTYNVSTMFLDNSFDYGIIYISQLRLLQVKNFSKD